MWLQECRVGCGHGHYRYSSPTLAFKQQRKQKKSIWNICGLYSESQNYNFHNVLTPSAKFILMLIIMYSFTFYSTQNILESWYEDSFHLLFFFFSGHSYGTISSPPTRVVCPSHFTPIVVIVLSTTCKWHKQHNPLFGSSPNFRYSTFFWGGGGLMGWGPQYSINSPNLCPSSGSEIKI